MDNQNVLTIAEAARIKGCSRVPIRDAIKSGKLHKLDLAGRTFVVRDQEFENFAVNKKGQGGTKKLELLTQVANIESQVLSLHNKVSDLEVKIDRILEIVGKENMPEESKL